MERASLVARHHRLIWQLVRAARPWGPLLEAADLYQEGVLGLYHAAAKFDRDRGVRFVTYAVPWVRHYIQRAVAGQSYSVRLPYEQLQRGEVPPVPLALDALPPDALYPRELPAVPDAAAAVCEQAWLADGLSRLPAADRALLVRRFGLAGQAPVPLRELGAAAGVSTEAIRTRQKRALARLRQWAGSPPVRAA